jgi:hypothetical protein
MPRSLQGVSFAPSFGHGVRPSISGQTPERACLHPFEWECKQAVQSFNPKRLGLFGVSPGSWTVLHRNNILVGHDMQYKFGLMSC